MGLNVIFLFFLKLFYKWSVSLYITGSVLVQANKFFGDALACEGVSRFKYFGWNWATDSHSQGEDTVDEEAIANYCMMYSEFLVPDNYLVMMIYINSSQNIDTDSTPRDIAPVTPMQGPLSTTATISGSHSFSLSRCLNTKHENFLWSLHRCSGHPVLHPALYLAGHGGGHDGVPGHWLHWPRGGEGGGEAEVRSLCAVNRK